MKPKLRKIKGFVAISPKHEGSNVYLPGSLVPYPIYEEMREALLDGWKKEEMVPCTITYRERK